MLGSLARDDDALPTMIDAGCRARCAEALAARPRPGLTDASARVAVALHIAASVMVCLAMASSVSL